MKAQVEVHQIDGYLPIGAAESRGPMSIGVVRSTDEATSHWIESIDSTAVNPELFDRVRRQWQQNVDWQPSGSLPQRQFVEEGERLTRVIDLPNGRALDELLVEGASDLESALAIAISLTDCLRQWHEASRVHGGLAGDCIFLDLQNRVQLREATLFDGVYQQDFSALPTNAVMFYSPESSGSLPRSISPASDLYSVGALIFYLLAGRPPIEATNTSEYLDRQLCAEAPRLRELGLDIPPALDDVVARLLRRDPRDRYETASGLLYDLELIVASLDRPVGNVTFPIGTRDVRQSLTEANLIGRDHAVSRVRTAIDEARAGNPNVQMVTGAESGYRKCFLDEVELLGNAAGMYVFRGAVSAADPRPLQSLQTVLETIASLCVQDLELAKRLSEATREHGATLSELMPVLAGLWESSDKVAGPDAYGSQRAAIALEELFFFFADETRGVAFLFDDLDLADELTQTVVRSLVERMRSRPEKLYLYMVLSGEAMLGFDFGKQCTQIALGGLTDDSLRSYLRSIAGKLSESIVSSIVEVADGNSILASTILRRMIDTDVVQATPEGWQAEGPLSESLRGDECIAESLEHQVDALSPSALKTLAAAAVIGQQFNLKLLSHLTGDSYGHVLEIASDALRRRLLWRDSQQGGFRFAHNRIHEKLRLSLDQRDRQDLHLRIAVYLEQHDPTNVFELAIHYNAAGDRDGALRNSIAAARAARQKYSLSIARDHLQIAKSWLRSDDQQTGLEIWEGLGEIELLSGHYDEAAANLDHALRLAKRGLERARIQLMVGELAFKRGRFAAAATEYEQALATTGVRVPGNVASMLGGLASQAVIQVLHTWLPIKWFASREVPSELDCLQLQLLSRLSHVYWFSRHKLWTLGNHLRSLNTAERFAPSATLAAVYSEHGPVMSLLRWFKRANRYAQQSLAIRTELGDVWGQGQSHHYHSVVKLAECRFQDAISSAMQAVELLRKMGDLWEMNMARYQAANAHYRIGNYREATEIAKQMFHCGREIGDLQATGISLDVWARTSPRSLSLEIVADEAAKSRPDAQSHAQTQLAYAVVLLHRDRIKEAINVLNAAIRRSEAAGHLNTYISPCYAWLGTALRLQIEQTEHRDGRQLQLRINEARKAILKALRVSRGFPGDRTQCRRELGLLYAFCGRMRRAERQLHLSIAAAQQHDQPVEELESIKNLFSLHKLDPESLGTIDQLWQDRLDELNERFGRDVRDDRSSDAKSSNLSLADRFVTVLQSGRRIAQALSADDVYAEASEAARKLLRGQNVDLVNMADREGKVCFVPASGNEAKDEERQRIESHQRLLHTAYIQGQAVCDASLEMMYRGSGSAIAAPIAFRGTNVAIVLVTHDELNELFSTDEQRIADFVTTLAGAALENADGFNRLRQLNDTLEQRVLDRTKAAEERAQQLAVSNTQLRETEDQLREAIVHANAANEAKGRFLATISHEIRTPLNGILGMTRLAQQATLYERRSNYLETVQESGESLLTLINDLLDVSKLESGKLELERIPLQPRRIADEICRLMSASATQKSVDLVCSSTADVPETILGDPSRLRQIIMNLIGNAIKFTERGSITLELDRVIHEATRDQLSIKVIDTGIGIPADKIGSVFESFTQVDSSTTRRYGGTGLGLAICRDLAEKMGGSIALQSELGVGSEFTVLLPIEIPIDLPTSAVNQTEVEAVDEPAPGVASLTEPHEFDLEPASTTSASDKPIRILVAEDGAINQEVIVGLLEMNGYEVVVANDGQEAYRKASEGSYDLCLMDVDMPKMDGIEATHMIRQNVAGADRKSLPIIAMTAHSGDQIWSKCETAGMNAYMPKPIDPETLFANVRRFTKQLV